MLRLTSRQSRGENAASVGWHTVELLGHREELVRIDARLVLRIVLDGEFYQQIDQPPDVVQDAGEREVEEPILRVLAGGPDLKLLHLLVRVLDAPPIAVLGDDTPDTAEALTVVGGLREVRRIRQIRLEDGVFVSFYREVVGLP